MATIPADWIAPDWPAPDSVRAFITTRHGGVSEGCWGAGRHGGMNLGLGSGDLAGRVERNRALLNAYLPAPPRWLDLKHGAEVVAAEAIGSKPAAADAATAITPGVACIHQRIQDANPNSSDSVAGVDATPAPGALAPAAWFSARFSIVI